MALNAQDPIVENLRKLQDQLSQREAQLEGKARRLEQREAYLKGLEEQLIEYRRRILLAIKEELLDHKSYEDTVRIMNKYREILQFVAQGVEEDSLDDDDDIML